MFFRVPLPPPTAVRSPHCTENEARCVWKNAAVKQLSVRWFPFKTERFIPAAAAAVSPLRQKKRSCALGIMRQKASIVPRERDLQTVCTQIPFLLPKMTTDFHILPHVNVECPDIRYAKLEICISELTLDS